MNCPPQDVGNLRQLNTLCSGTKPRHKQGTKPRHKQSGIRAGLGLHFSHPEARKKSKQFFLHFSKNRYNHSLFLFQEWFIYYFKYEDRHFFQAGVGPRLDIFKSGFTKPGPKFDPTPAMPRFIRGHTKLMTVGLMF